MSIVAIAPASSSVLTLPPAYETERPLWKLYTLELEDGAGIPSSFSTLSNVVLGSSEFINEAGTLKGLCPVIEPTFSLAFQEFLHAIGTTTFLFQFGLKFKKGSETLGTYSFGFTRTFNTDNYDTSSPPFGPIQCAAPGGGTYDAYPFTTDITASYSQSSESKQIRLAVDGNTVSPYGRCNPYIVTESDPMFEMYDQHHLDITNTRPLPSVTYVQTGSGFSARFNGNESFSVPAAKGGRFPFALDIPTPCSVEMTLSTYYRVGSSDGNFFAVDSVTPNEVYATPNWFGAASSNQIQLVALWERTQSARPSAARMQDGRLVFLAETSSGVETRVGDLSDDGLHLELTDTTAGKGAPSVSVARDGSLTRSVKSGTAFIVQKSTNGGNSWT